VCHALTEGKIMRKLFIGLFAGLGLLVSGAPIATAGPLTSINLVLGLGALPPAVFSASGLTGAGSATGTGAGATWTVAAGAVPTGVTTATIPLTAAAPISQIQIVISNNASGAFAGSSGGTMAVVGAANVKGFGGFTLLGIPLSVGVTAVSVPPTAYGIAVTAFANAWTTKSTTVALTTPTSQGATTAMATGANGLVNGGGTVVLVSALNVLTNIAGQLPAFVTLTLNFVPEPGTLLLLGAGVAGLLAIGRSKRS
jgi:hypothetical protein